MPSLQTFVRSIGIKDEIQAVTILRILINALCTCFVFKIGTLNHVNIVYYMLTLYILHL